MTQSTAVVPMLSVRKGAAFERAVAAGATAVSRVSNQHGWRMGRVADPFGHHWEIATLLTKDR